MINGLRLRNYRSFRGEVEIPFGRITVLLGRNNSAKTALIRLPLLIASAIAQSKEGAPLLPLHVRGLTYASDLRDLVHHQVPHESFGVGVSYADVHGPNLDIDFVVQLRETLLEESAFVSRFRAEPVTDQDIAWQPELGFDDVIRYSDARVRTFDGVLPRLMGGRQAGINALRLSIVRHLDRLCHLTSIRQALLPLYERRAPDDMLNPAGSDVPYLMCYAPDLLAELAKWYETAIGMPGLGVQQESFSFRLVQQTLQGGNLNLAYAGQGVQQVLPVAAHLCGLITGVLRHDVLAVEEPELHLHPAAHGGVADLLVRTVEQSRAQLLVETHSEVLLLRLRRHVAEGRLHPSQLQLLWFDHAAGTTTVRPIVVASDGSVSSWPTGIFTEDLNEVRAIARASEQ